MCIFVKALASGHSTAQYATFSSHLCVLIGDWESNSHGHGLLQGLFDWLDTWSAIGQRYFVTALLAAVSMIARRRSIASQSSVKGLTDTLKQPVNLERLNPPQSPLLQYHISLTSQPWEKAKRSRSPTLLPTTTQVSMP